MARASNQAPASFTSSKSNRLSGAGEFEPEPPDGEAFVPEAPAPAALSEPLALPEAAALPPSALAPLPASPLEPASPAGALAPVPPASAEEPPFEPAPEAPSVALQIGRAHV